MLNKEQTIFAAEDARARLAALVELMYFTDKQAMSLLHLYTTVGVAAGGAAASGFSPTPLIPLAAAIALAGATAVLVTGSLFCFFAMQMTEMPLPGRGAEFWKWATHRKIKSGQVFGHYLDGVIKATDQNRALNKKAARLLGKAKLCGVAAPLVAVGSGLSAFACGL